MSPTKKSASPAEPKSLVVSVKTSEKVEIATKKAYYDLLTEEIKKLVIEDDEDFEYVSGVLLEVKRYDKEIEARKKLVTDPLNAALRELRTWFQPIQKVLSNNEAILKKKIGDYKLLKEKQQEEQMRKIAEASKAGDFEGAYMVSQNLVELPVAKGISTTRKWDYKVTDLSLVPREYLTLDHDVVKKHIKEAGKDQPADIPGVVFEEVVGVTGRT